VRRGSAFRKAHLQGALGAGYRVTCPRMPDPDHPRYAAWRVRIADCVAGMGDGVILVGHSLGGSVLLKYLSEEGGARSVAGLFLLAAPRWGEGRDWQNDEFLLRDDFPRRLRVPHVFLYHSRDDEVVPFAHLAAYAARLPRAAVRALDGYRHYFEQHEMPELVRDIRGLDGHAATATSSEQP
jgi:predicted alpha/beta hydrolase family esterase